MKFDKVIERRFNENTNISYGIIFGNGKVLLIKGGQNSTIKGYENKYLKIATHINKEYGLSVVVSSNPYDRTDSLGQAIEVIAEEIIDFNSSVYYMGVSKGASLGARFGYLHQEIRKMLLIHAPLMINWPYLKSGVEKFQGEKVTFIYGSKDPSFALKGFIDIIDSKSQIQLIEIEGADHNFINMDDIFMELTEKYLLEINK